MKFNVTRITEQGSIVHNEDRYLIKNNVFAVFDGATNVGRELSIYEMTPGEFAAETLRNSIEETEGIEDGLRLGNDKIEDGIRQFFFEPTKQDRFSSTATVVRINENNTLDYWNVADSFFFLINKDGKVVLPFELFEFDREVLTELKKRLADNDIEDPIEEMRDIILAHKNDANVKYGVFNGEQEVFNLMKKGSVDLTNIATVVLFTDGMNYPSEDPNAPTDYQAMADLYLEGGVEHMLDTVREMEEDDSEFKKYPRFKMHDDATVIAVDLL